MFGGDSSKGQTTKTSTTPPGHVIADDRTYPNPTESTAGEALSAGARRQRDVTARRPVDDRGGDAESGNATAAPDTADAAGRGVYAYDMPVLWVNPSRGTAQCGRLPFEFQRTTASAPLRLMISDDTPGGSQAGIRSSAWLAAVTAAMERNDTMDGVRISVEFSGHVDGPSAGGIFCLSVLSALDGRSMPKDFAMTGTIMPDGTIGVVGGVALKLRAAAAAGIKRVCIPAFQRFEDQGDGPPVDLFREGERLGLELHPVEHIGEAYAVLHRLSKPGTVIPDERSIRTLPKATEDAVIKLYQRHDAEVKRLMEACTREEMDAIASGPLWEAAFNPVSARRAFQSGRVLYAMNAMSGVNTFWKARNAQIELLNEFEGKHPADKINPGIVQAWRQAVESGYENLLEQISETLHAGGKLGYRPDESKTLPISAQLAAVNPIAYILGIHLFLDAKMPFPENIDEASEEELIGLFNMDATKSLLRIAALDEMNSIKAIRMALARTFRQMRPNSRAKQVGQLFHTAALSINQTVENDIVAQTADALQIAPAIMRMRLAAVDLDFATYQASETDIIATHEWTGTPERLADPEYHIIADLFGQIEFMAKGSSLLMKNGPDLDLETDEEGNQRYGNTLFLQYMVNTARSRALVHIEECRLLDIPCIAAIAAFEQAEIHRDNPASDKMQVVQSYWRASLSAKGLVMSFKP